MAKSIFDSDYDWSNLADDVKRYPAREIDVTRNGKTFRTVGVPISVFAPLPELTASVISVCSENTRYIKQLVSRLNDYVKHQEQKRQ